MKGEHAPRPASAPDLRLSVPGRRPAPLADTPELRELVKRLLPKAFDQALWIVDPDDADDVAARSVEELCHEIAKDPRLLIEPDECDALLHRITKNRSLDVKRRQRTALHIERDLGIEFGTGVAAGPDTLLDEQALLACINATIARFPDRMQVVWKFYRDGVEQVVIAELLQISKSTIETQLRRGKDKLRTALTKAGFGPNGRKTS